MKDNSRCLSKHIRTLISYGTGGMAKVDVPKAISPCTESSRTMADQLCLGCTSLRRTHLTKARSRRRSGKSKAVVNRQPVKQKGASHNRTILPTLARGVLSS